MAPISLKRILKRYLEQKCEEERKRATEAEAVAQQKAKAAEKQAQDLQRQIQCKEAALNEARKKAEGAQKDAAEAKKKATDAEQKIAEADAKKAAAEEEASDLRQKHAELKRSKEDSEQILKAKVTELENRLANAENDEQPSSSTHASEANKRIAQQENDIMKLNKDIETLKKELSDAKQLATDAYAQALEAGAKKAAAEKKASDLRQKHEELKLRTKITELENRRADTETSEQPPSSTDGQSGEGLNEAKQGIAQNEEINELQAENKKLKKDLSASKSKENARRKSLEAKDDRIAYLKEPIEDLQVEIKKLKKLAYPETLLEAVVETARMRQAIGSFDGVADKIRMKCDGGGVSVQSNPSHPNLPKVLLELKPSFFDKYKYDHGEECLAQTDCSLLVKGFASQAFKQLCWIEWQYGCALGIHFKNAGDKRYYPALFLATDDDLEWILIEDNAPYVCTFEMNAFVLLQAAQKLSPLLLEFSSRGQDSAVSITDSEDHLIGGQREYLWRSLPGGYPHANDFKAEFSTTTPDTHLRIYVDPKYLRQCVMASSGSVSKTVEVSLREDTLRLRYGNQHSSLAYHIPTVKPDGNGDRCYSPIDLLHGVLCP